MARLTRCLRPIFASALLVLVSATPAAAVTIRDLLNLKAAGLSDDILIALIETDGSIFRLSADDVISLHRQGLSERVILAMIDTARRALAAVPQPFEPQSDLATLPQESYEPPVVVNVSQTNEQVVEVPVPQVIEVPVAVPVAVPVVIRDKDRDRHPDGGRSQPVYWGFGGERRPDTWPTSRTPPPKGKDRR
jgi:hypothetical protein